MADVATQRRSSSKSAKPQRPRGKPTPRAAASSPRSMAMGLGVMAAGLLALAGLVAAYIWWDAITRAGTTTWEFLRYGWAPLAILAVALPAAAMRQPSLVLRHGHRWAAGLALVAVAAGSLQLAGQGLGGQVGGWVVGSSAAWGILRTAGILGVALALAFPAGAVVAGRIALIALGFLAVYLWIALAHVLRWVQAAGDWIGRQCTAVSPSLSRFFGGIGRGIANAYRKVPVHAYVIALFAFIAAIVLRRSGSDARRRRPAAGAHDNAAFARDAFLYEGMTRESAFRGRLPADGGYAAAAAHPAAPFDASTEAPPRQPATLDGPSTGYYASPGYLTQRRPAPDADAPPFVLDDVSREEDAAQSDALVDDAYGPAAVDDLDAPEELDAVEAPAELDALEDLEEDEALEDLEGLDDLEALGAPDIIDLRSEAARHGGRIAKAPGRWELPSLDILKAVPQNEVNTEAHHATARLIEQTLAEFNIEVAVKEIRPGPVVTQYGVVPGWIRSYKTVKEHHPDGTPVKGEDGKQVSRRVEQRTRVQVNHVLGREKDLALALAAPTLRFQASVPGESFIGLEVPNAKRDVVTLRSSLESNAFLSMQKKAKLPIALGLGSGGEPVLADLADMPHLLIAGSTGSGKSVCMNVIICSLLMQCTPMDLQMYLVDPKRVELTAYNGLPHLAGPVLVEVDQAVPALQSLVAEMQSRYKRFEQHKVRNISVYNSRVPKDGERMPYLILVIDELADLMMTASGDVETALCRLAQLGRAAGIHLVVATQRPSVDVLTGLIKANFPSRMSFAVSSQVDSRTVLDTVGAEKLLGRGDLLFMSNGSKPKRLQGAYLSDDEVDGIVDFWTKQKGGPRPALTVEAAAPENEEDSMLQEAQRLALAHSRISASLLQRKMGIGYAKAASLLDHLEERGIVGPGDPGKSREVISAPPW